MGLGSGRRKAGRCSDSRLVGSELELGRRWRAFDPGPPRLAKKYARRNGPGSNARHAAPERVSAKARKLARRRQRWPDPAPPVQPAAIRKSLDANLWQRRQFRAQPNARAVCGRIGPLFAICPPACAVRLIGESAWPAFPRHRWSPSSRSGAVEGTTFGSGSGEHVFFASRNRTRKPSRSPPYQSARAASSARSWKRTGN